MKRRLTGFEIWLEQLLSDVFEAAEDVCRFSLPDLALHARVSTSTVYAYWHRRVKYPRLQTVYKLCKAVGMDMKIVKSTFTHKRRRAA